MTTQAKMQRGPGASPSLDAQIHILSLEDDELAYRVIERIARREAGLDCRLTWVTTVDDALGCLERQPVDLCLVDYRLGAENGFDLMSRLPRDGVPVPCILLTGANDNDLGDRALESGFCDYLVKDQLDGPRLRRAVRYALERHRMEDKLRNLAFRDALTSLYDRAAFADHLEQQLRMRRRTGSNFGVIYVDLDRFKMINDTAGHQAGDAVLVAVARRLEAELRESDIIARLGGDEFAVCCPDVQSYEVLASIAGKLVAALSRPVDVDGVAYPMRCSVGIALSDDAMKCAGDFVKASDLAMYEAKRAGGNRIAVHSQDLSQRFERRFKVEAALVRALAEDRLRVFFQPIVDLADGHVVTLEALARWIDGDLGEVHPAEFIPIAEASGLIGDLSVSVFRHACRDFASLQRVPDLAGARLALNLSVRQLADAELMPILVATVRGAGVDPARVEFEVTEGLFVEDEAAVIDQATKLRGLGARISIDDFGTGYSSLSRLQRYPIDTFKIDRSFIAGIETDAAGSRLCAAIVELGRALDVDVVSEGVETSGQLAALLATGCDYAQGYMFGRPAPADAISTGTACWSRIH